MWLVCAATTNLAFVDDTPIGVHVLELAICVHVACFTGWVQPESFAAPQQDV